VTVIDLTHPGPTYTSADDPRGRFYYLPELGLVVVVQTRYRDGWRCAVIAALNNPAPRHIALSDVDLTHAQTTITVTGPRTFALAWRTRVHQRWRHGGLDRIAHALAVTLRPADSLTISIDDQSRRDLIRIGRLRPAALPVLLARLTTGGMLTTDRTDPDGTLHVHLTLPDAGQGIVAASGSGGDGGRDGG
jgi:hypothetical protein